MEINILTWLLAASPITVFLIVTLGFKWRGSRAGAFSWIITIFIAWLFFGANFQLIAHTYIKAFLLSIDVLLIIWTALFLYVLTEQAGTVQNIGNWLSNLTSDKASQGIFLGWLFPSFLQGLGGFGVPVAVSAPLLVSTGFDPIQALMMASVGHAWGVTFGSMSSSFQTLMSVTGLSGNMLAPPTALLLGIAVFFCGLLVTYIADGWSGIQSTWFYIITLSVILGTGQYSLATNGLWIIAVTVPSLVALIVSYLLINRRNNKKVKRKVPENSPSLFLSILPYLILVLLTLLVNLVPSIKNTLDSYHCSLIFPEIRTTFGNITPAGRGRNIQYLNHPGVIIFMSGLVTYFIFLRKGLLMKKDFEIILKKTINQSIDTTLSIFTMVGIAVVMSHTQMTHILAEGISQIFNRSLYPFAAPFIGALGAFITGSNSNSNVLFAGLQMQTAELLGISVPVILAGQTAGGALGSMMAPAKVILGCATVGLGSKEGKVIGKILTYGLFLVLVVGISTFFLNKIWK